MNIFFLDKTPYKSAQYLCDKHVVKMILESAQMLSTAVQRYTGRMEELYKPAYQNHPMTKWVGDSRPNFEWSMRNAHGIHEEYASRYARIHKSSNILNIIWNDNLKSKIPERNLTTPPQCMPDKYRLRSDLYVKAYRNYYKGEKEYFAKWQKGRPQPHWWQ